MQIFKKNLSRKTKITLIIIAVILSVCVGLLLWDIIAGGPLSTLFSNRQELIDFVDSIGAFGPVLYTLLQALQTVIAPIPASVLGFAGGFMFSWWGILWTTIGLSIGSFAVFTISRKFGQPLVEKIFKRDLLKKFDFLVEGNGSIALFLIFLIPGLPDDMVCYIAGLTKIPIFRLMWMVIIGRLPAIIVTNMLGSGFGEGAVGLVTAISVTCAIVFALLFILRKQIMSFIHKFSHKKSEDSGKTNKN